MRIVWLSFVFALIQGCSGTTETSNAVEAGPSGTVVVSSSRDEKFMHGLWALVQENIPKSISLWITGKTLATSTDWL